MNKVDFLIGLRDMLKKEYPDAHSIEIKIKDGRIDMRITKSWDGEKWTVG